MYRSKIVSLKKVLVTAGTSILVIIAGIMGMNGLAALRQAPAHTSEPEKALSVSTVPVVTESVRLQVAGYGQAAVVNTLTISPRVSGYIVEKHPGLEEGGTVSTACRRNREETLWKPNL